MYPYMPPPDPLYMMYVYSWWLWMPLYYIFSYVTMYMMMMESYKLFFDTMRKLLEQLRPG